MTAYCPHCRARYHFKVKQTIEGGYVKMGINPDYDSHICMDAKRSPRQGLWGSDKGYKKLIGGVIRTTFRSGT